MQTKNINITTNEETLIPIYYIDSYKDTLVKEIFKEYKFKNSRYSQYLLNLCIDLCIDIIAKNPDSYIVFTYPISTMFYRKEKDIDSMGNLIFQVGKYLNFYFRKDGEKYYFKNLFSINKKYLKNKKAQHLDGTKNTRTKDLDKRYYINFWNKRFLRKLTKRKTIICIIDDVSSTGGTLLACKNSLKGFGVGVELYSLAH
jgi:predicted amidophosphoribosyltransferase